MIEIVVNILFRLLLIGSLTCWLLLLLGIHLWMIIVIVMIAMHLVWIMVTRMHARHASCTTSTTTTMYHRVARTHHIAISEKHIYKEDEDEQDV